MNKLDYIAQYLGIGSKIEHEGFSLWTKCMGGDPEAWNRMRDYNAHDVEILEAVYLKMRAWDKMHPNVSLVYQETGESRCVCCGSKNIANIGKNTYTSVFAYESFRCMDCGKVMRGRKRDKESGTELVTAQ
jgi:DNA-directed RNA polymerase subunit RPC12/RpoP